jgi:uncharacterized protein
LQLIDSRLDSIRNVRGELPLEVEDLEDEIAGLDTRLSKMEEEVKEQETEIKEKKILIKDCQARIKKYEEQQKNVRNNREFDAITKEMEFQDLEIQLSEKRIKEQKFRVDTKTVQIDELKTRLEERKHHLKHKKAELEGILAETQKEEDALIVKSAEYTKMIDQRLIAAYNRIRNNVINRLAVVPVERGASGGSFFTIPPQRQLEIAARRKVITDEHSGRILVDPDLAREEEARMEEIFKSLH